MEFTFGVSGLAHPMCLLTNMWTFQRVLLCVDVGLMVSLYAVVWEMCMKGFMLGLSL